MTTETIESIESIYTHLKSQEQKDLFQFIRDNQFDPFNESGFKKSLLQAQSFRDEKAAIVFPNKTSGYRIELNDNPTKEIMKPTVVFYFLDNGHTYFRLQEPTFKGKLVKTAGMDTIKGIPSLNNREKDLSTLVDALQLNPNIMGHSVKGRSVLLLPKNKPGFVRMTLNRGQNRVIHGRVHFNK